MKRLLFASLLIPLLLGLAAPLQAQSINVQPDCMMRLQPQVQTGGVTVFTGVGTSAPYDNRGTGCVNWYLIYSSFGTTSNFSANLQVIDAPNNNQSPGTFVAFQGTINTAGITFPTAATSSGTISLTGYYPYMGVSVTSFVGSGRIEGVLYGWRSGIFNGSGSSGGVTSVTGTTNEITCTPTTGAVVCSIPSPLVLPGNLDFTGSTSSYPGASSDATYGTQLDFKLADGSAYTRIRWGKSVQTVASSSGITPNTDEYDGFAVTSTVVTAGTVTVAAPSPSTPNDGDQFWIRIKSLDTFTWSWNAVYTGSTTQALPTAPTGSNYYDYILFQYNAVTSKWNLLAYNAGFSQ